MLALAKQFLARTVTQSWRKKRIFENHLVDQIKQLWCFKKDIWKPFSWSNQAIVMFYKTSDIRRNILHKFTRTEPIWSHHVGVPTRHTNIATGKQRHHIELTLAMQATDYLYWTNTHLHKHCS